MGGGLTCPADAGVLARLGWRAGHSPDRRWATSPGTWTHPGGTRLLCPVCHRPARPISASQHLCHHCRRPYYKAKGIMHKVQVQALDQPEAFAIAQKST